MKIKSKRLSKFIRRMNRGIALGLAIIFIMAVWLIISAQRVKNATPELERITKEYLVELFEVSAEMNGDTVGEPISDATAIKMENKLASIVEKYYSDSRLAQRAVEANEYRTSGQEIINGFSEWRTTSTAFGMKDVDLIITQYSTPNGSVYDNYTFYVEQKASKFVEVYFNYEVEATMTLDSADVHSIALYPFTAKGGAVPYAEKYPVVDEIPSTHKGPVESKVKFTVSGRLIFVRDNGEWRIACMQSVNAYASSSAYTPIIPKEVG